MKEVAPYHNEALLAQGHQPEPTMRVGFQNEFIL